VDQNFKVCVCDFGLTQAKPRDVSNLEYDPHGSPLYMAPEVFLGDYNEKCDVYSLGIVLWEMLCQKEAFEEVNQNLQTFVEAVCYNDFRPPIPPNIPNSLVDLMRRCWAKDPVSRPTMAEIVVMLNEIAIEAAIPDPHGQKVWRQFFFEKVNSLYSFLF
jgi:serine/threonine protein kinase